MNKAEFDGIRAKMYGQALEDYPNARKQDVEIMKKFLEPKEGEVILEVGAGSGFFSKHLSELVGEEGKVIVSDPSHDQLQAIKNLNKNNVRIVLGGAEEIDLDEKVNSVWSFGAMHHCFNKKKAFENFKRILKNDGKIIICDVFEDSKLAKHFDERVDKYCVTGHKVEFWTDKMAKELCEDVGFSEPSIVDLDIKWVFDSKEDVGDFLYKIHAMTKTTKEECLKGAEEILGVEKIGSRYELNWPMKAIIIEDGRK